MTAKTQVHPSAALFSQARERQVSCAPRKPIPARRRHATLVLEFTWMLVLLRFLPWWRHGKK